MEHSHHKNLVFALRRGVQEARSRGIITLDGNTLAVSDVVAVGCYRVKPTLTKNAGVLKAVDESICILAEHLARDRAVYGVNTGFGGSADVRTSQMERLQSGMVQHVNVGVLLASDKGLNDYNEQRQDGVTSAKTHPLHGWNSMAIPVPVVRAMMVVRANSLLRGHSGVRIDIIENIASLVSNNMTPVVPLRGSISASGDLCPLSYIAGVLEGNPDVCVHVDQDHVATIQSAPEVLAASDIGPLKFSAKEALGITNGTATSTGAAAIAIYQAHALALLAQLLTSVATEALNGRASNYDHFISQCRPHRGQVEAAGNISGFLRGSMLAHGLNAGVPTAAKAHQASWDQAELAQDRYALRTAPQWIGPQLENLLLAQEQVETELNSTTDNPLVDTARDIIHHGGNFQAASITSAMEKVTSSLQNLGRLMFAQSSELLDCKLSTHLPPNLTADDPSTSFTTKGFDVNMAAYMAEMSHLSNPISCNVQSAEMHNQSVNSMAFVSARIALDAVEVLSLMMATHIYGLCQALDLRCLQKEFETTLRPHIESLLRDTFVDTFHSEASTDLFQQKIWKFLVKDWMATSNMDLEHRARLVARNVSLASFQELWLQSASHSVDPTINMFTLMDELTSSFEKLLHETYSQTRQRFFSSPPTLKYLGDGSAKIYNFVRCTLRVPFHRGLEDHPTLADSDGLLRGEERKGTLGTMASIIYSSIRDGSFYESIFDMETAISLSSDQGNDADSQGD